MKVRGNVFTVGSRPTGGVSPAEFVAGQDALQTQISDLDNKADGSTLPVSGAALPLIAAGGKVLMFINADGHFDGGGLQAQMSAKADARAFEARGVIPLIASGSRVVLWVNADGSVEGVGLSGQAGEATDVATRLSSDGATLSRMRAKISAIRQGVPGARLRIAVMGDSWADLTTIPLALRALASDTIGVVGEGWQAVQGNTQMNGVSYARSAGWTLWDASTGVASWPYGAGADGKLLTTTGATDTLTLGNLTATDIKVYSFAHGGTWRYRTDGGSWTTVTEGTGGGLRVTRITGLAAAAHTLEIDTTGNAGTVSIGGVYSTVGGSGVEILKMGNASLDGPQMASYVDLIGAQMADLSPDLVICLLGTNDSRRAGDTPQRYTAALGKLADVIHAASRDTGLIFVAPSQASTTGMVTPIMEYSDALDKWTATQGYEFLSLTRQMGTYADTQPLGAWADTVHHSATGADMIVRILDATFLHLGQ